MSFKIMGLNTVNNATSKITFLSAFLQKGRSQYHVGLAVLCVVEDLLISI